MTGGAWVERAGGGTPRFNSTAERLMFLFTSHQHQRQPKVNILSLFHMYGFFTLKYLHSFGGGGGGGGGCFSFLRPAC